MLISCLHFIPSQANVLRILRKNGRYMGEVIKEFSNLMIHKKTNDGPDACSHGVQSSALPGVARKPKEKRKQIRAGSINY